MLYLVRHGETYDNANNILSGWNGVSLTKKGINQARDTALELKDIHFDICFCSPLKRTKQTLKEIIKYHPDLKVIYDDRLKERNYGSLTGTNSDKYRLERWNNNIKLDCDIETIEEMNIRITSFFKDIEEYKGKNILIVAHSGTIRMSYFYFNGAPSDGIYSVFQMKNADVLKIEF